MDLIKYQNRKVVLVDEADNELGIGSLVEAHQGKGKKHRAFSLVLYRKVGGRAEVLLQKRAVAKPVFARKWANTCCYNMAPGEEYLERARSRVKEELGIELGEVVLEKLYQFSYYAPDPSISSGQAKWCENELDQVIVGEWEGQVVPSPDEAEDYRWVEWHKLKQELRENPREYGPWWKEIVGEGRLEKYLLGE